MINGIQNLISNPTLYNMTQSTVTQITSETCLKAVGRPSFILMDKDIDPQTKKYSSVKEFLYQMTCLGIYLAAVMPLLKKGTFALARKMYKNEPVFKAFNKSGDFMKYYKMDEAGKAAKLAEINQNITSGDKFTKENINEDFAKGLIEGTSIIGSVTGLAIVAPIISHPLIHPILKACGLDKKEGAVSNDKKESGKVITQPQENTQPKEEIHASDDLENDHDDDHDKD